MLTSGDLFTPSFKALFVLFILAVILESGLAVIFNWKLFFTTFDTKATKPLVAILVACLFVFSYKLDVTTTLVNIYIGASYPINVGGQLLTALVIAGGSAGVNSILQALGFRAVQEDPPPVVKPPPMAAWLAAGLRRSKAVGTVNVIAGDPGSLAVAARTKEIATLRALGFGNGPIVVSIMVESLCLALVGGILGAVVAYLLFNGFRASTLNWQSYSQVAFTFAVMPLLLLEGILSAALIGFIGGLFPAIRATRLPITQALHEN